MKKKYFIITIDTEADNQWNPNQASTTENAKFLPRFQELSEKYGFKPVWLTTYEMTYNNEFVKYFKNKQDKKLCEIGMHLHAWTTPPKYELKKLTKERPYLIEYPSDIMEDKIIEIDKRLTEKFGVKPVTHRSGRWTINEEYANLLIKYNYLIDCSVTPHISWEKHLGETGIHGSNYNRSPESLFYINNKLLEVPMTIRKIHKFNKEQICSIRSFIKTIINYMLGTYQWVRIEASLNKEGIIKVIDKCNKKNDYIMFMIHSSELMPMGSPYFKTQEEVEKLYDTIEFIFKYLCNLGYKGITLRDYYREVNNK